MKLAVGLVGGSGDRVRHGGTGVVADFSRMAGGAGIFSGGGRDRTEENQGGVTQLG